MNPIILMIALILGSGVHLESGEGVKTTIATIISRDLWSIAKGDHKGKPLILRFRSEFQRNLDIGGYPKLIQISWPYLGDASGMPDTSTSKAMEVFENRLVPIMESDLSAVLVAVITNDNQRIWVYYASTVPAFKKRINAMPHDKDPYPIQVEATSDPKWKFLRSNILKGMVNERP